MDEECVDVIGFLVRRRLRERKRQQRILNHRRVMGSLRDNSDPFSLPDKTFKGRYRLPKHIVRDLVDELRSHVHPLERSSGVPLEIKVLCALNFFAQGSYQKSVGCCHDVNLSQPAVSKAITTICKAMNSAPIMNKWISFPHTHTERRILIERNYSAFKLPGVLGFLDGTHISIVAPNEHEESYVNRKSYHSLNVQLVCDASLEIFNVLARFPGSSHDSFVWKNSALRQKMIDIYRSPGGECWLLGDMGYPHEPWLQLPILNAAPESPEGKYTRLHLKARATVERCIGVLKQRFRCLLRDRALHYDPTKAGLIVNCCVILHNMCRRLGISIDEDEGFNDAEEIEEDDEWYHGVQEASLLNEA